MALPKMGIAKLSDITEHGRMDAGFLIALTSLREKTESLRARYSEQEAVDLLKKLNLADKASMRVLMRGSNPRSMTSQDADKLAEEYPHLALAIVAEDAQDSVERIKAEIQRSQDALERLLELSEGRISRLNALKDDKA